MEAEALYRLRHAVAQPFVGSATSTATATATALCLDAVQKPRLHHVDAPGNARGIAAIKANRLEAIELQVSLQPGFAALLVDLRALIDAAAIEDHDRRHQSRILGMPPTRRPVSAALFLERAVAEKGHQAFAGQGRVHIVQFGEAEIAAFLHAAGGVRIHVRTQRGFRLAIRAYRERVEIRCEAGQTFIVKPVARRVRVGQVADDHIERVDGRHAMALAHHPAARAAVQRVHGKVGGVGRHHVERAARVSLRIGFEVCRQQRFPIHAHATGVGHVHDQPHAGAGDAVRRHQPAIAGRRIRQGPG